MRTVLLRPHRDVDARLGSVFASPTSTSSSAAGTPPGPMTWAVFASAPFARRSWRELLYALAAFPLGLVGFVFVVASLFFGIYLSIALVGVALLALSSLGARQLGALNRALARRFLDEEVAPPPPFRPRPGVVGWVRSGLSDRPGWRARAYLVLKFPVALASFVAVMALRLGSLWLVLAPAQWAANVGAETVQDHGVARHYVINFGSFYFDTWPRTLLLTAIGLAGWWLAPWALRALLYLDRRLLADLLGPSSLPSRVRQLERARAGAGDDDGPIRLFGLHPVEAALKNPARRVLRLLLTENAERRLKEAIGDIEPPIERVTPRDLDRLLGADTVHQGAALDTEPLPEPDWHDLAASAGGRPLIVLDQVTDPHNVGAILRSSAVFGASGLVMNSAA